MYWKSLPAVDYINEILMHFRKNQDKWLQCDPIFLGKVSQPNDRSPYHIAVDAAIEAYDKIVGEELEWTDPRDFESVCGSIIDLTRFPEDNRKTSEIQKLVMSSVMALIAWPEKSMRYFDMDPDRLLFWETLSDDPAAIIMYPVVLIMKENVTQ